MAISDPILPVGATSAIFMIIPLIMSKYALVLVKQSVGEFSLLAHGVLKNSVAVADLLRKSVKS
ncbi:hypothetical protein PBNK5_36070 [Pectobacterium brasiliense]